MRNNTIAAPPTSPSTQDTPQRRIFSPRRTVMLCASTLVLLSACHSPTLDTPTTTQATHTISPEINITCSDFNKLAPQQQAAATDRLLRHYTQAPQDSSDSADARQHSDYHKLLSGNIQLRDPSFLTLAQSTCKISTNQNVRLLTAMGFSR